MRMSVIYSIATILVFSALAGAQYVNNPTSNLKAVSGACGRANVQMARKRIIGGFEANKNSIPWIVSLRQSKRHFCGGTLIRVNEKNQSDIVITAAHCASQNALRPTFEVFAGSHNKATTEKGEDSVPATRVIIHPKYSGTTNDIAIIKLSRPFNFSTTIQPVCMPSQGEQVPDGSQGIVAGWGRTKEGGQASNTLQQVIIPKMNFQKCKGSYSGYQMDEQSMICGGFDQGGKDACQGDSGGPYFFENQNGYKLQGVVSWGAGCARPNAPGVYARVANYVDWIHEQITALSQVKG